MFVTVTWEQFTPVSSVENSTNHRSLDASTPRRWRGSQFYWPAEESEEPIGGGVIAVLKSKPSHTGYTPYISNGYYDSTPTPLFRLRAQAARLRTVTIAPLPVAGAILLVRIILLNLFWVFDHTASPTDLGTLNALGSF